MSDNFCAASVIPKPKTVLYYEYTQRVYADGTVVYTRDGYKHRDDDLPAIELSNGDKEWWVNGKLHRDGDKPAVVHDTGEKKYFKNGKLHRENGPALFLSDITPVWFWHGKRVNKYQHMILKYIDKIKNMVNNV